MKLKFHIYQIYFPTSNKSYIGLTQDIEDRMYKHLRSGSLVCKALYKYNDWKVSILHTCKSRDEANRIEIEEIRNFNSIAPNGYNLTRGGDGASGYKHTKEAKKKIGNAEIGNKYKTGSKHSEETKEKMRLAKLGKANPFSKRHKIKQHIGILNHWIAKLDGDLS